MHNYDQWDFGTGWIHFGSHTGFQIQVLDLDWHSQMLLQHCFLCFLVKVSNSFVKRNFELHHNMGFWAISTDVVELHLVAVAELMMKLGWKKKKSDIWVIFWGFSNGTDLGNLIGDFDCGYSIQWKFSNFPAIMILREISFSWFQKVKNAVLTVLKMLNFDFQKNFTLENVKN